MTTIKTWFSNKLSFKVIVSTLGASLLIFGLSGCGHDNALKKASLPAMQKAYVQLTNDERACLDGIAERSARSPYKEPSVLREKCPAHYPAIAKKFSKTLGKTVTVSDLNVPDFWIDFFKKNHDRILTLKTR